MALPSHLFTNSYNLFCFQFSFSFFRLAGIYEVLKDKEKRDIYDRVLVEGLPDWRSPAFYFRRMRKIGLVEALLYVFVLITVFQYFIHKAHHWEKKFTLKESEHIKIARKSTRKKQKAAGTHLTHKYGCYSIIVDLVKMESVQLNKCETDPCFLQTFRCRTMFISVFCKICDLNTEREIVFVFCNVYLLALDNTKR